MVDDLMPHLSISSKSQKLDSVQKLDNLMDVDHPNGDFTKSHEDHSKCDNKYVDSLPSEVNNHLVTTESPDQDCVAEVKETHVDAAFCNLGEPSAISLNKMRAEEDIKVEFSADMSLSEHEHSASLECSRETEGNDVKDICVDEGLPVKEKTHVEDIFKSPKSTLDDIYPMKDEEFGSKNDKIDAEWLVPVGLKSCTDLACEKDFNNCESKVLLHQHGSENETKILVLRDFLKEKVVETISKRITAADDLQLKTSSGDGCKNDQDIAHKDTLTESEVRISSPTSEETDSDRNIETALAKTEPAKEAIYKYLQPTALNSKDDKVVSSADHPQLPDAALMPRRHDPFLKASEHFTASAPLQRDHFESSFASVGHYSSSITYSGPIAHSGSLSHRSDASTASTRSFAFPVLKNEWNFSPVRMQKADRRHLRRHRARGWLNGLFCCKF